MEYVLFIGLLLILSLAMAMDLSWNNVLAVARNAMVFEDRHQDYGAFVLRRDYVKRLIMAVVGSVLFFGLAVSIPMIVAALSGEEAVVNEVKIVDVDLDRIEEEKKEEPPPPPPEPPPPVKIESVQFTQLEAVDEPVEEPPPQQEELAETNAGTTTQEGEKIEAPPPPPPVEEPTFDLASVQEQPEFPGGIEELYKYLGKNVKYPSMESDAGIQGRVFVEFVVSNDGSITEVVLKRGVSGGLDKEATRVVKGMPKWTPGKMNGKAVKVRYILPVNFVLR
ncbi:MAG: energy transducer TonB [Flavobacteriales bacterium]|nr:energy transducer TonB [Flavobacteriales bacterium]HRH69424.1 energy transducer TonB [Flavobacteriales bacterium]